MKERPILFSTPMVKAILEGRKTVTRRVIKDQPIVVLSLRTSGIFVIDTTIKDFTNGKLDFETDTSLSERGLYGWQRWSDLFTYEVQRIWKEGVRGLVCVVRTQIEKGVFDCIIVPQQCESNKDCTSIDLHSLPRNATEAVYASPSSRQQPREQQTGELTMGNSAGELAGQEGCGTWEQRRKTSNVEFIGHGERAYSLGYRKGHYIQKAACKDIGRISIRYTTDLPWIVNQSLWVRETWGELYDTCDHPELPDNPQERWSLGYVYKADDYKHTTDTDGFFTGWKPSIHMPKEACRLKLEILSIRVERLHDITEEDAIREGIGFFEIEGKKSWRNYDDYTRYFLNPIDSFRSLWISINGQESWNSNPWVWVINFRKL